jgi:hypothetical protein
MNTFHGWCGGSGFAVVKSFGTYSDTSEILWVIWTRVPMALLFVYEKLNRLHYLSLYLSIYLWLYSLVDFGRFFRFLILYTFSRTPWTGDQPIASPLPTQNNTNTE